MKGSFLSFLITAGLLLACGSDPTEQSATAATPADSIAQPAPSPPPPAGRDTSDLERQLIAQGLVDIHQLDTSIRLDMRYSTPNNFLKEDVYGDFDRCYLQPAVAERLAQAQAYLEAEHPDLRLIVFDCVRPRSVQYQMWDIVKGTDQQDYVAPPGGTGSMHNYGAAVDLGLWQLDTGLVDMGTPFDFFGPLAQPRYETDFLRSGELTAAQVQHRHILRLSMKAAGFHGILSEWWHFVGFPRDTVKRRFQIVE
ncbi:MAG: peptidase M15D vanX D-ala-D-ala dipeptidase [Bacteroidetes bacterium]|nr:MAG: peptidase M15D vanX D-ala-D-ala dipeptidase [Bacteroidota bacterium]